MDGLGGALRELAREAQPEEPAAPALLWQRGRQRVRRRRAIGGVVAAAVVAVLAFAGSLVPQPTVTMPAGNPHEPAIPKNVYSPNRLLVGVSDAGAPGQLAAIVGARGEEDSVGRWFGIGATTGEYRHLDLPGMADGSTMSLSPDGHRLAYWITGPTRKSHFGPRDELNAAGPLPARPVTGVGVYDTHDGSVKRHQVPSDFGLRTKDSGTDLFWLSEESLLFAYDVAIGSNMSRSAGAFVWNPDRGRPVAVPESVAADHDYAPGAPGAGAVRAHSRDGSIEIQVVDALARPTGRSIRMPASNAVPDVDTLWGNLVVRVGDIGKVARREIFTGVDRGDGAEVAMARVSTLIRVHFLGWTSPTRILVTATPGELVDGELGLPVDDRSGEYVSDPGIFEVDLESGTARRLGEIDPNLVTVQVAASLLDVPFVEGVEPPSYLDVLITSPGSYVAAAVVLAVVALGVFGWRRRRAQG